LPDYIRGRTRVLQSFLGRSSVFALEEMERIYGEQARTNLEREIRKLADLVESDCVDPLNPLPGP